jgi:flavin-dependent dehydrogenase
MASERSVDVLILGGGPAGSTAGAMLARAGIEAVIVEGDRFPRFHVGESLLPHTLPLLDDLGIHQAVCALPHTRRKEGASFVTHDGSQHVVYWFDEAFPPAVPHAYQVRRDEFDACLLANAAALGVDVLEGWKATAPIWEGRRLAGLRVEGQGGEERVLRARVVLDASGQVAFLANRMGWRFPYAMHRKVAAVSHFRGVWLPDGREAGNITIAVTDGGWFWLIPFADDTASVGAVMDVARWRQAGTGPEALFTSAVSATPEVGRRLANATRLLPFRSVQNFSYRVIRLAGDGYCLIGDAAGFLDPIFSTGVFVATTTAASAAEDIIDALGRHGRVDSGDFAPTVSVTRALHRVFFSFIRAYYNPHFLAFFFNPSGRFQLPQAIISLLAADVLGPGRLRKTARFRTLLALAWMQELGCKVGRPLVAPLGATPGSPAA